MKICGLALLLLLLILPGAVAQEAPEITLDAAFSLESGYLTDEDYTTCISLENEEGIEVSLPEEKPCYGVYLSFHGAPVSLALQEGDQAVAWEKGYYNAYIPLPGFTEFSLKSLRGEAFSISEIHLFGQGDVPGCIMPGK